MAGDPGSDLEDSGRPDTREPGAAETASRESDATAPRSIVIERGAPTPIERIVAFLEVLLCSDYPTQLALGGTLAVAGVSPFRDDGSLSFNYVVALSLIDTVVLVGLVFVFLRVHEEDTRTILFGRRPLGDQMLRGVAMTIGAFAIALATLGTMRLVMPGLHNIEENPLQALMRTPREAAIFAFVVVMAGGVREEIQRAFILHRFERWLGGGGVGLVVSSVAFGAGHLTQGYDAAIATAVLGAYWGFAYLRQRSAVPAIVSHSGFNLLEVVQFLVVSRLA